MTLFDYNPRRIRVMHLIHQLGAGGAENGIVNLVNHIDPEQFETAICAFVGGGVLTERVDRRRTRLFDLDKRSGNDVSLPFKLWKLFRQWRPHIVHTHAWGTLCEGVTAAKLAGVPVVVHGEHGTMQLKRRNRRVQRVFWNMADQVLSVSTLHRDALAKTMSFPREKIKVIMNGVDTRRFSRNGKADDYRSALGLAEKQVVIGTVGRLVPVKNHELLIRAFADVLPRYPDARLLIIGDGPLKAKLTALVTSLGIASHVTFPGRRADIPELLQAMDIFVLSSVSEGMSNTILEAMSCQVPVVATDVGGNAELVRNGVTGWLVPAASREKLVDSLIDLVASPARRQKMGEQGRKTIEKSFSLEAMVGRYESLYHALLREKRFKA